eukprot:COSAG02_NODE_708_length_18231_cov_53.208416_13_plen_77_part_00
MVSQVPGSPREEPPDDDPEYAAFVDEMPSRVRSTKSKCNATILKRGVPIHASYGHYPNKRNFMLLGSEASVTYNIL